MVYGFILVRYDGLVWLIIIVLQASTTMAGSHTTVSSAVGGQVCGLEINFSVHLWSNPQLADVDFTFYIC